MQNIYVLVFKIIFLKIQPSKNPRLNTGGLIGVMLFYTKVKTCFTTVKSRMVEETRESNWPSANAPTKLQTSPHYDPPVLDSTLGSER